MKIIPMIKISAISKALSFQYSYLSSLHLLCLLVLNVSLSSNCLAKPIDKEVLISTQEWPPYQIKSPYAQTGFAINALKCVMDKVGQKYRVIFLPWGRAQNGVAQGKYDGFFSASQNDKRDNYAVLSQTFIEQEWNFYLLKDTNIGLNKASIKSHAQLGSRMHANTTYWLHKEKYQVIHENASIDKLLKLLIIGKIDAIMENKLLFRDAINRSHISLSNLKVVPNINKPLGVYFGKVFIAKYPDFIESFNLHTEACRFTSQD
ncbi:transporter substrate-binding domain-containing protein [Shewanella sp. VB17]|uniref:substrate-binding periplasmic protein n=1 Tax=Shewanella sp. VB17 TaxID=2739432 RepID=UPI00156526DD|nr:transporter substrate-binding domain-containing protein [Shewanella sp. VB17]NRD74145.1 transporter substrate-binding domain-containing protein [Shewanella sp. VB17]